MTLAFLRSHATLLCALAISGSLHPLSFDFASLVKSAACAGRQFLAIFSPFSTGEIPDGYGFVSTEFKSVVPHFIFHTLKDLVGAESSSEYFSLRALQHGLFKFSAVLWWKTDSRAKMEADRLVSNGAIDTFLAHSDPIVAAGAAFALDDLGLPIDFQQEQSLWDVVDGLQDASDSTTWDRYQAHLLQESLLYRQPRIHTSPVSLAVATEALPSEELAAQLTGEQFQSESNVLETLFRRGESRIVCQAAQEGRVSSSHAFLSALIEVWYGGDLILSQELFDTMKLLVERDPRGVSIMLSSHPALLEVAARESLDLFEQFRVAINNNPNLDHTSGIFSKYFEYVHVSNQPGVILAEWSARIERLSTLGTLIQRIEGMKVAGVLGSSYRGYALPHSDWDMFLIGESYSAVSEALKTIRENVSQDCEAWIGICEENRIVQTGVVRAATLEPDWDNAPVEELIYSPSLIFFGNQTLELIQRQDFSDINADRWNEHQRYLLVRSTPIKRYNRLLTPYDSRYEGRMIHFLLSTLPSFDELSKRFT